MVTELMMEVNSGGFQGYLVWDAGVRRFSALTALAEVGGQKHAQLLRSALDRLRPEDRASVDTHLQDALQGLSGDDPFCDLDAEFWTLGEPSDLASYVRTNPDEFFGSQSE